MIVAVKDIMAGVEIASLSTYVHRVPNVGEEIGINGFLFEVTQICTFILEDRIEIFVRLCN